MNGRWVIVGTFAVDPIRDPLAYWGDELGVAWDVELAPYGQVFQELLDPTSETARNKGLNAFLVRPEDLRTKDATIEAGAAELAAALRDAASASPATFLVAVTPPSSAARADATLAAACAAAEERLRTALADVVNVRFVGSRDLVARFGDGEYEDPDTAALGRVPYTNAFYAVLGTTLARLGFRTIAPPHKVIVLDCDNTLWTGICGEDGPHGIRLDPGRIALQKFMRARLDAGLLLCIASKNNPEDVEAVFAARPEMPLARDHFVSARVGWGPKSASLRELAAELELGLDSFIFVDDDPVVCGEVRAQCPDVLTLQIPADEAALARFLEGVWPFDTLPTTKEDAARTALYKQNAQRSQLRRSSGHLRDFLAQLALDVKLLELDESRVARVAQLTQRTNQFNMSTIRRTEGEIDAIRTSRSHEATILEVSDRFGDYGLVGVVLSAAREDALHVDTFLLSCRVLGRGVEHKMLAELGARAVARGLSRVEIRYSKTAKNAPAKAFLDSIGAELRGDAYVLSAERAAAIVLDPDAAGAEEVVADAPARAVAPAKKRADWQRIATELQDAARIVAAIAAKKRRSRADLTVRAAYAPPRAPLEDRIAEIWADVLALDVVGIDDDFFELGGDSLQLMQVMARLRAQYAVDVSTHALFEAPTVAGMAAAVASASGTGADPACVAALLDEIERYTEDEARALAGLVEAASPATAKRARAPASGGITTLAIATRSRPDRIARSVGTFAANATRHHRDVEHLVVDDSPSLQTSLDYKRELRAVAAEKHVRVAFADVESKRRFADALHALSGVERATIAFALRGEIEGAPPFATYVGANRNAILLHTAGERVLSVDDDTDCRPILAASRDERPRLVARADPGEMWFLADEDEANRRADPVDADVIGAHEEVLGASPVLEELDVRVPALAWPSIGGPSLADRVASRRARVVLSFNGVLGDCGWGSPFGYWGMPLGSLVLDDASHERLVRSYADATSTRTILRLSPTRAIGDAWAIGVFTGFDNRTLLPPFLPVQRGEDMIFGQMIWRTIEESCFAHLPMALLHVPGKRRRFSSGEVHRSASGYDSAKLLLDCIALTPSLSGAPAEAHLEAVAGELVALGTMPGASFQARVTSAAAETARSVAEWMEGAVRARGAAAPSWAEDVTRYVSLLRAAASRPDYGIPLDLEGSRGEASALAQRLVLAYGKLLRAWPALVAASRDLRARGEGLAQPLA